MLQGSKENLSERQRGSHVFRVALGKLHDLHSKSWAMSLNAGRLWDRRTVSVLF